MIRYKERTEQWFCLACSAVQAGGFLLPIFFISVMLNESIFLKQYGKEPSVLYTYLLLNKRKRPETGGTSGFIIHISIYLYI